MPASGAAMVMNCARLAGSLVVIVILYMPQGILGFLTKLRKVRA